MWVRGHREVSPFYFELYNKNVRNIYNVQKTSYNNCIPRNGIGKNK
jgi:hypothetical protein